MDKPGMTALPIKTIVEHVADFYRVSPTMVIGEARTRLISLARHIAMYLARNLLGYSFPRIGNAFGRDHTTAVHACQRCEGMLADNRLFASIMRFFFVSLTPLVVPFDRQDLVAQC